MALRSSWALLLRLATCSSPGSEFATPPPPAASAPVVAPEAAARRGAATRPQVLQDVRADHVFFDRQRPDHFRLQLLGDSALTATAHLSIVNAAGDTLLSETFPARGLLDYGLNKYGDQPTDAQRSHYIRKRAAEFFGGERFQEFALSPDNEQYKHINQAAWQEVKRTGLPPLSYSLNKGEGRYVGYSPRQRKAVIFFDCC